MIAVRSILFDIWLFGSLAVMGLLLAPTTVSRRWTIWAMRLYCRQALWMLNLLCGLRVEIRGEAPRGPALIAAKHQSFLDVLVLMRETPAPAFVMKKSLIWAPVLGLYALRIGCAPIDRAGRGGALQKMKRHISFLRKNDEQTQIVIFPQGTRVPPGEIAPYRRGVAALYDSIDGPCWPAATNAGCYWPRRGRWRRPGVAVFEFLPPIPPGLDKTRFMTHLETAIETASARLENEARHATD